MNNRNIFVKMPIVSCSTGETIGYEILLRRFNKISLACFNRNPDLYREFAFEIIEEIFELDFTKKIRDQHHQLYINMTISQFLSSGTLEFLFLLYKSGKAVTGVVLELTEQTIDCDLTKLKERVLLFRCFGFLFAVDDFGKEGSNFQRVFELEPNIIKLDRSLLISYNASSTNKEALIALVHFCHSLDKKVIIEGIETEKQYQMAKECKADLLQGFYFGLPEKVV